MTPTKEEMIAALLYARERLFADDCEFICYALPRTDAGDAVRLMVRKRLYPTTTLGGWMQVPWRTRYDLLSIRQRTLYRIQWIDAMILELRTGCPPIASAADLPTFESFE